MTTAATVVFLAVVGARFLVPLLIPRYPLPAIVTALILDGVDQTIFQSFGFDPPGYQGYDKAMDVYYLAIAYLSTLRNWTSLPYRLFWNPARVSLRAWIAAAATIWIVVKLPQEYWIHIARLDVTDLLSELPWLGPALAGLLIVLGLVAWFAVRPRLPARDWTWHVAADPLPPEIDTAAGRDRWVGARGRLLSAVTVEKVLLVGLLSVIFAQVLPGRRSTNTELFLGVAVFVVVNAAVSLWVARGSRGVESMLLAFVVRVLMNIGLVVLAGWLLERGDGELNRTNALFFVLLLSLITLLDDRYRPVYDVRFSRAHPAGGPTLPTPDPNRQ